MARRLDWRGYLVGADERIQPLARATWRSLKTRGTGLPEFADRTVRVVYAFVLCDRAGPTLLAALEGIVWRLDVEGRIDYSVPDFDERRLGQPTAFLADVLPQGALQTGDRWQPDATIRQAVVGHIWPGGVPALRPAETVHRSGGKIALQQALAAVGQADIARSMSRLAEELTLSSQARTHLLEALQVDPELLEDFIAAETEHHDGRVH